MDVITLRRAPGPGADPINLLHEASHLLIRRHQVRAPILAADDEDLVAFQEEMVHLMDSLRVYEDLAFAKERGDDWETWMLRRWGHVVFRIRYGLADHQLDERELAQFHAITGFHVDLDQIREIYLAAGIPERLLPLTLNDRFTRLLRELNSHQLSLRD